MVVSRAQYLLGVPEATQDHRVSFFRVKHQLSLKLWKGRVSL